MSSRTKCLLIINDNKSHLSPAPSESTLQNAFGLIIMPQPAEHATVQRDRCSRPLLKYNHNYDPTKPPNLNQPSAKWYTKTDASIAWITSLVLYLRWKWAYFKKNWTS